MSKSVLAERSEMKSKSSYNNSTWDLADAYKSGKADPARIHRSELPPAMKAMSPAERKHYVEKRLKEREEIQKEIRSLSMKRKKYIQNKQKNMKENKTFGQAVMRSLKKQAQKKGFSSR